MILNNENLAKLKKYYLITDLIIMTYGLCAFFLNIIFNNIFYGKGYLLYFLLNFFYILIKCSVGSVYMIKWTYNFYTEKTKKEPLAWTIGTIVLVVPCLLRVGNQIDNYFNIKYGILIVFAIVGVAYWVRLIFNSWKNLNIKRIIYIISLILNTIITYYFFWNF